MRKLTNLYNQIFEVLHKYTDDIFKLFLRLYVADAFFRAGLTKLGSWDSQMPFLSSGARYLFKSEYSVPPDSLGISSLFSHSSRTRFACAFGAWTGNAFIGIGIIFV